MYMKTIKDTAIIEQLRMNAYASLRTAKAIEEIPAITGTGDQRHANERLQSVVVCCTAGPEG